MLLCPHNIKRNIPTDYEPITIKAQKQPKQFPLERVIIVGGVFLLPCSLHTFSEITRVGNLK